MLGRVDLILCNDSGPGHLAASCGRPALPIFGPTDPDWFRPWGDIQQIIIRDICPWRPCFDYCKFDRPYCMTKLLPESAWPEIHEHLLSLIQRGVLPKRLLRPVKKGKGVTNAGDRMNSDAAAGQACVVALVATYRRAAELQRLLRSLEASLLPLRAAIIIDNAADEKTRAVVEAAE